MSITVNTNMSSLICQRSLTKATSGMNTALQRMSTGLKINSAKDDAAGCAISSKMDYKLSSYGVAQDNAQMGQSMLDTASGSLSVMNNMLQRMRDLSEQAANGTYGREERAAMQAEVDALTKELYRIKNTTDFNGKKVLGEEVNNENTVTSEIAGASLNTLSLASTVGAINSGDVSSTITPTIMMSAVDITKIADYKGQIIGIESANDLAKISTITNGGQDTSGVTFALTKNINLSGYSFSPIGNYEANSFKGIFDGNGHTISSLKTNTTGSYNGLFGFTANAEIKNLKLTDVDITGATYVGGVAAWVKNTKVTNCSVSGTITGDYIIGGLIGSNDRGSVIDNCTSSCTVISRANNGSYVFTSGAANAGCLVGENWQATIKNSSATGSVKALGSNSLCCIGGIVGLNTRDTSEISIISNCSSSATITGYTAVGGLVGLNTQGCIIEDCSSSATVTGTYNRIGGLVGHNQSATISKSSSSATVVGKQYSTGGLVGWNRTNAIIEKCTSSANVSGNMETGGLVGNNDQSSRITDSYSSATVNATSYWTGGLVGYNHNSSTILNGYSTSSVNSTVTTNIGGFCGSNESTLTNCYYDTITSGQTDTGKGSPKTTAELQIAAPNADTYVGWNNDIWDFQNGEYPTLDWEPKPIPPVPPVPPTPEKTASSTKCNLQVGINNDKNSVISIDTGFKLGNLNVDLTTEESSSNALSTIDAMMAKVNAKQLDIGATSNRLASTMEFQSVQMSALTSANSLIKDADIAKESASYIKNQILQQTTATLLATANQNPSIALSLV